MVHERWSNLQNETLIVQSAVHLTGTYLESGLRTYAKESVPRDVDDVNVMGQKLPRSKYAPIRRIRSFVARLFS